MPVHKRKADPSLAQSGSGDPKVVAHPAFREIPPSLFPLKTKAAQAQYDTIAMMLFDAGLLTSSKRMALSSYAMQFDQVTLASKKGTPVGASSFACMDKARKELALDEIDKTIAASAGAPTNKFARTGFTNRR